MRLALGVALALFALACAAVLSSVSSIHLDPAGSVGTGPVAVAAPEPTSTPTSFPVPVFPTPVATPSPAHPASPAVAPVRIPIEIPSGLLPRPRHRG